MTRPCLNFGNQVEGKPVSDMEEKKIRDQATGIRLRPSAVTR